MTAHPHPTDFYLANRIYHLTRQGRPSIEWGALTDGPESLDDVVEKIVDYAQSCRTTQAEQPSIETVKVWRFQDDVPPRDVTEDVMALVAARLAELEEDAE